jgi:ribosomal protein S20
MADETKENKLPKKKATAAKRHIQDEKKHLRNRTWKRRIQTVRASLEESNSTDEKKPLLVSLYSLLDKAVKNRVMKKGKASRLKSRAAKKV